MVMVPLDSNETPTETVAVYKTAQDSRPNKQGDECGWGEEPECNSTRTCGTVVSTRRYPGSPGQPFIHSVPPFFSPLKWSVLPPTVEC